MLLIVKAYLVSYESSDRERASEIARTIPARQLEILGQLSIVDRTVSRSQ